ncbi:methylated-DNA--[protein]-cysteine S-methyltransferase [Enterococcus faecalis]|uniref:methylated-DNA--[protein]-cysteine S-methyltransferase n=1 Tax=Enterococcus faecalis TaxID=1351 RepID=UPI0025AF8597|nr:methylated-DNA--[protein]-cysteine S-methyltransferase [Enterococcus faecalis]MDN3068266.1 methylated-DNA--[protein]-cysteine S-methyltransferase [Enterococcus faecalis]
MAKKIYYAQQEWQNDHYYLGVTDAGLAFVGSANQSIEELKNWYPQAQLEASEKKTAPYKEALISYLNQHSTTFACPIDIEGTPFQKEVWQALQEIPYSETMTYQEISEKIGRPRAVRAVGTAIGKNPLLMVIPCHRVIGSKGQLTGYRGGLAMKQALLTFEQS